MVFFKSPCSFPRLTRPTDTRQSLRPRDAVAGATRSLNAAGRSARARLGSATKLSSRQHSGPPALPSLRFCPSPPCLSYPTVHDDDDDTPVSPLQTDGDANNEIVRALRPLYANHSRCTAAPDSPCGSDIRARPAGIHRRGRRKERRARRETPSAGRLAWSTSDDKRASMCDMQTPVADTPAPRQTARLKVAKQRAAAAVAHRGTHKTTSRHTAVHPPHRLQRSRAPTSVARHGDDPAFYANLALGSQPTPGLATVQTQLSVPWRRPDWHDAWIGAIAHRDDELDRYDNRSLQEQPG